MEKGQDSIGVCSSGTEFRDPRTLLRRVDTSPDPYRGTGDGQVNWGWWHCLLERRNSMAKNREARGSITFEELKVVQYRMVGVESKGREGGVARGWRDKLDIGHGYCD